MMATSEKFWKINCIENGSRQCWVSGMLEVLDGLRNMGCRCAWQLGHQWWADGVMDCWYDLRKGAMNMWVGGRVSRFTRFLNLADRHGECDIWFFSADAPSWKESDLIYTV